MMTSRSDIDTTGFRRAALLKFLADGGIHLANSSNAHTAPAKLAPKPVPPWANARRGLRRLTLPEAANVLTGVDPLDGEWRGDHEWREFESAKRVLQQALEDGDIQPVDLDFKSDSVEIFSTSDLRGWALSAGYEWPIPEMVAMPGAGQAVASEVGNKELLQCLQESERERTELRAEVERLKAEAKQVSGQAATLAEKAVQVGKLEAELSLAQNEIRQLKDDLGQGKSLSTWQKLAVGMAVDRYQYKPELARSEVPAIISSALAVLNISVTSETVRNCLKPAAEAHLPIRR